MTRTKRPAPLLEVGHPTPNGRRGHIVRVNLSSNSHTPIPAAAKAINAERLDKVHRGEVHEIKLRGRHGANLADAADTTGDGGSQIRSRQVSTGDCAA